MIGHLRYLHMKIFQLIMFCVTLTAAQISYSQEPSTVLLSQEGVENAYPRLSKDDRHILYQSNASGKWQLMIMNIDARSHKPVMEDAFNNNFPDWSPDNEWIAFVSDRDGNEEIYLIKTDGTNLQRITNDAGRDIHPYFSPDGKSILINSTRGNGSFDIYKYTIATKTLDRITDTAADETCARYSPDMTHIVFLKNDTSLDDVYIMDLQSKALLNISNSPRVRDGWPMYSFDGKYIYFSSMYTGAFCIYRIRSDGKNRDMLSSSSINEEDARVCVSKDNNWFIFNKRKGKTIDIRVAKVSS